MCRTLGDLAAYMRDRDPDLDGSVIVEVERERSGAIEHDHNAPGDLVLIYPSRLVAVYPADDRPDSDPLGNPIQRNGFDQ